MGKRSERPHPSVPKRPDVRPVVRQSKELRPCGGATHQRARRKDQGSEGSSESRFTKSRIELLRGHQAAASLLRFLGFAVRVLGVVGFSRFRRGSLASPLLFCVTNFARFFPRLLLLSIIRFAQSNYLCLSTAMGKSLRSAVAMLSLRVAARMPLQSPRPGMTGPWRFRCKATF